MMGACKKIVRLIIMSNISRRKFLKGAGVAVLAVAASGVLAGCSSAPEMVDVTVKYIGFKNLQWVSLDKYNETISVVKGQETIKKEQLKNLGSVCKDENYTGEDVPEEITIVWTGETPVAEVKLRKHS